MVSMSSWAWRTFALAAVEDRMKVNRVSLFDFKSPASQGPIRWLVLCGALLVAAIAIGTAVMVGNFRERALNSSERELENTVLLLARHFDQQLEDFTVIQKDIISHMQLAGIVTGDDYRRAMSGHDVHLMLKASPSQWKCLFPRHQPF